MKQTLGLLLLIAALSCNSCSFIPSVKKDGKVQFNDYKVYAIKVESLKAFEKLNSFSIQNDNELQTWREARELGDITDLMVSPQIQEKFEMFLNDSQINYSIKIHDVQRLIDLQTKKTRSSDMDWTDYHTLDEIYKWLDVIEERYPDIVTPFFIGNSYEGRPIRGIKISYKPGNKAVFIESNIHAREWITSASITYFIDELLVPRTPNVRDIAMHMDWYIIPVLNVDGFVYSHEVNRLWRKSRLPSDPTGKCIGTDLNRNFDFLWMLVGASANPCTETYAGPYAESDPEIKQMVQFINNSIPEDTIKIYISLHSYGQYVLSPWGHTDEEFPQNYDQMMEVAKGFSTALKKKYNTEFTYGSSSTTLYKVSGSGKEWALGVKNIPIPYTIELRDKGVYGFVLPPQDIIPVSRELVDGLSGMIFAARDLGIL